MLGGLASRPIQEKEMSDLKRGAQMRVLNIQRCAEAIQLLYKTYVIEQSIADARGIAIRAIDRMILDFGGESVIEKIEAVPWSARLRASGEKDLIELEKSVRSDLHKGAPQ